MSLKDLQSVRGVEVVDGTNGGQPFKQLIASDLGRILFWNLTPQAPIDSPGNLASLRQASGYVGAPAGDQEGPGDFGRLRADSLNRLWFLEAT